MDENQMNQTLAEPPKKKKTGIVIVVILLVLILLFGAGAFFLLRYHGEQQDQAASEEIVNIFMKEYGRLRLDDAYETFHPDVRDGVIDEQIEEYMMSSLEGLERYLDLYYGGMEMTYNIDASERLSEEELEDLLSEIDDSYDADLDIAKAYSYQVTETFSGENGTLKVRREYFVGKEEEDWYIIAVTTDKIVKDNVSFVLSDYLAGIVDEFIELFGDAINECDGEMLEDAYALMHPEMRDVFVEEMLNLNDSADLDEFAEVRNSLYGGFSWEYEILEVNYFDESEWRPILRQIERYFDTEFEFDMRGVWAFDLQETFSGTNGTVVILETFFIGEKDGKWYIIDIATNEIVSNTLEESQSHPTYTNAPSGGYASAEEAIEQYLQAYENDNIVEAYETFHPAIRDVALEYACYSNGASDVDEYEEMINDLFGDSLSITYTITQTMKLYDDEAEALLSFTWNDYGSNANISDACLYLLEEHCEGSDTSLDREELIFVGRDGNKWFLYNSIIIPEDIDIDDYLY